MPTVPDPLGTPYIYKLIHTYMRTHTHTFMLCVWVFFLLFLHSYLHMTTSYYASQCPHPYHWGKPSPPGSSILRLVFLCFVLRFKNCSSALSTQFCFEILNVHFLLQWCQLCETPAESGAGERMYPAVGCSHWAQAAATFPSARCADLCQWSPGVGQDLLFMPTV